MSFSFFKPSRPKTPQEVTKAIKDSLVALDTKTVVEVKALEKALEEVDKNFATMRCMLCGDGEVEPNVEQVSQLAIEFCKEDVLALLVHKLPILGWEARKDLVHCWSILLKQIVGSTHCCVQYIENHIELLDFLVVCYDNKEIALNCGNMLRECIKFPILAKYILESASFELFFKFVELPNFDVASDAFSTFKDLLTKHSDVVSGFLVAHYEEFFDLYENLMTSSNYVTKRQSLKDSRKNIQIASFHIFKVFVANPNKPREIKVILAKNHDKLLELLQNLSLGKGSDDEQFEEEKEVIMKEIERLSRLPELVS
ncbi:calcium-binding protein 39-like [Tripterygium wilfordii]|uniref:Calcium-binding protein 39-like n=1 Tax=Tripterygium wilfordii TaxID=458696 RepID=A0A7J7CX25_TRIWF|nr:calcium-binding protein 39-like [Tripterygium wilfordii]